MAAMTDSGDNGIFGGILGKFTEEFYLLFRLIFAFLVALHGAQKAFLLWGFPADANPNGLGTLVDIAGWVELIAAFLIAFGVLTRLGAGALVVTMIVAYFGIHNVNGTWPHLPDNGGEVAVLWFAIAGLIGVLGSRKYGLERMIFGKEIL